MRRTFYGQRRLPSVQTQTFGRQSIDRPNEKGASMKPGTPLEASDLIQAEAKSLAFRDWDRRDQG